MDLLTPGTRIDALSALVDASASQQKPSPDGLVKDALRTKEQTAMEYTIRNTSALECYDWRVQLQAPNSFGAAAQVG